MAWATLADIQARLPGRTINETSKPSSANVTGWIGEAEATLKGVLAAVGLPTNYTGDAALILKVWVCDFAEGHTRQSYASAGGAADNADGKDMIERWEKRLDDICASPSKYGAILLAGSAGVPAGVTKVRGSAPTADPIFDMDSPGEEQL